MAVFNLPAEPVGIGEAFATGLGGGFARGVEEDIRRRTITETAGQLTKAEEMKVVLDAIQLEQQADAARAKVDKVSGVKGKEGRIVSEELIQQIADGFLTGLTGEELDKVLGPTLSTSRSARRKIIGFWKGTAFRGTRSEKNEVARLKIISKIRQ